MAEEILITEEGSKEAEREALDLGYKQFEKGQIQTAITPNGTPINVPLQNLFAGSSLTGPNPGYRDPEVTSKTLSQGLVSLANAGDQWAANPGEYAKPYTFNSGVNDAEFDHFYTHPEFKKLGYSPYKDNEQFYNDRSSWYDDFLRFAYQTPGIIGGSAKAAFYNWGHLFDGSPDREADADAQRRMTIANASRPGAASSVINFSSGLANLVGFIAEAAAETYVASAALGAGVFLAPETGGTSAVAGGAAFWATMTKNVAKSGVLFGKLKHLVSGLKSTSAAIKSVRGVEASRNLWKAAKSVGKFVNPFEQTVGAVKNLRGGYTVAKDLTKGVSAADKIKNIALISKSFGAFQREMTHINTTIAFARGSGGSVANEMTRSMTNEYYAEHNKMPEGTAADKIYDVSQQAGVTTTLANIPLFFLANKIVLARALRGFKPTAAIETRGALGSQGILVTKAGAKEMPKGFKKLLDKDYWKQSPVRIAAGALNYGKANLIMGAQMPVIDAIARGTTDYYTKIYEDPALAGHKQMLASMGEGLSVIPTVEGGTSFLHGFIMGGVLQFPQKMLYGKLNQNWKKIQDQYTKRKTGTKGTRYDDWLNARNEDRNNVINIINDVVKRKGEYADAVQEDYAYQTALDNGEAVGDRKASMDEKTMSLFSNMYTLNSRGYGHILIDQLKSLKELKPQELADAFENAPAEGNKLNGSIHERLDKTIARAEDIQEKYIQIEERFGNPYDPDIYDKNKNPEMWAEENRRRATFEKAKFHAAYSDIAFADIVGRQLDILQDMTGKNKPLAKASTEDFTVLLTGDLKDRIKTLGDEIKAYQDGTPEQRKIAAETTVTKKKLERINDAIIRFKDHLRKISSNPDNADVILDLKPQDELQEAYYDYVRHIGKAAKEHVLDKNIENSFQGFKDYLRLGEDAENMAIAVNALHDPGNLIKLADNIDKAIKELNDRVIETFTKGQAIFNGRKDSLIVFNEMGKLGAYLMPHEVARFENGDIDLEFRDAASNGPIDKASAKYKKLQELVIEYNKTKAASASKPASEAVKTPAPPTEGEWQFPSEPGTAAADKAVPLTPEEQARRTKNIEAIDKKINILSKRKVLLDADMTKIVDTLTYLDELVNSTIDFSSSEIDSILNQIDVLSSMVKSKTSAKTIRGERVIKKVKDLKQQVRSEFQTVTDITERIRDLKEEVGQMTEIRKDLTNQLNYYKNLLADPTLKELSPAELTERISGINKKITTLDKLIDIIKNAIRKSIEFIKSHVLSLETGDKKMKEFKKKTGYRELSTRELRELIDSVAEKDQMTVDDYSRLKSQYERLEKNVTDNMDSIELLEDVKITEESRLNDLYGKLQKYHDQIRYIKDLLNPAAGAGKVATAPKKDVPLAPKATNSQKKAETTTIRVTAEQNKKEKAPAPAVRPENFKVVDSKDIVSNTGEPGAAQYNRPTNTVRVNRELLKKKFEEKAWTKPNVLKDNSKADALPEDVFTTYEQWERFVIEHEFQHSLFSREQFGKDKPLGEYENEISKKALEAIEKDSIDIEAKRTQLKKDLDIALNELNAIQPPLHRKVLAKRAAAIRAEFRIKEATLERTEKTETPAKGKVKPIRDRITEVKTPEDLIALEQAVMREMKTNEEFFDEITSTEYDTLIRKKREDLTKNVTFDAIKKGTYLVMKDTKKYPNGAGVVIGKTKDFIKVKAPDSRTIYEIPREKLEKEVENIYSEELAKTGTVEPVSKEAEGVAKENIDNLEKAKEQADARKGTLSNIEKVDAKVVNEEFLKSIGCK